MTQSVYIRMYTRVYKDCTVLVYTYIHIRQLIDK
jgi:hypothetical protein